MTQKEAYQESARTLCRMSGMEVTGEMCRAVVTQTRDETVLQHRREEVEQMYASPEVLEAESAPTSRMVVGVDGCHVLKNGETVSRPLGQVQGKAEGDGASRGRAWEEVKVGVIGALEHSSGRTYTIKQKSYVTFPSTTRSFSPLQVSFLTQYSNL